MKVLTCGQAVNIVGEPCAVDGQSAVAFFATPHTPGTDDQVRDLVDNLVTTKKLRFDPTSNYYAQDIKNFSETILEINESFMSSVSDCRIINIHSQKSSADDGLTSANFPVKKIQITRNSGNVLMRSSTRSCPSKMMVYYCHQGRQDLKTAQNPWVRG
ncbi:hypothetical protein Neosp_002950 [[Neocosmospora] mangrovei]